MGGLSLRTPFPAGWPGGYPALSRPLPCLHGPLRAPVGFLPCRPQPPTPAQRLVPISAFRPLLRGQPEPEQAGVGPPRPAGRGFPSTEPSSPGFKKQIAHVCVIGEMPSCSPPVCSSHFSRLGKGSWLGVCRPSSLCSWERQGAHPPRSGLFLFGPLLSIEASLEQSRSEWGQGQLGQWAPALLPIGHVAGPWRPSPLGPHSPCPPGRAVGSIPEHGAEEGRGHTTEGSVVALMKTRRDGLILSHLDSEPLCLLMQKGGGSLGTMARLQLWPPSAEGPEDGRAAEDQGCSPSILPSLRLPGPDSIPGDRASNGSGIPSHQGFLGEPAWSQGS